MTAATPRVLLSALARRELGAAIQAAASGHALQLLCLEDIAADDTQTVQAAYISRDITGLSTKHEVLPELAACYRVLRRSPQLAWVHTHSAGVDRPIYAELMARGVVVSTSAGANAQVVAHTALGAVLALSRRFPQLMAAQQRRQWAPLVGAPLPPDLAGQTAVLVGWGAVARSLQPLLSLLGLRVVVVRQRGDEAAASGIRTMPYTALPEVLPGADWLLLACPLSPQTHRLVNARALTLLPPHAHLVNVARGEIVDQAALVDALQQGRLAGAFLDVFDHEPLAADSPLWALPQVMVTPHMAGHAAGNAARWSAMFIDNLVRWLKRQALLNAVSKI